MPKTEECRLERASGINLQRSTFACRKILYCYAYISWGDEIDLSKNGLCSTFYIVNACAQAAFLLGDVMLLTMAFKQVKRNGRKPAVQNLVYVCNINFMFMLFLCLVYEATSCVKKQKSFRACVYDVRIVQYDRSNNRSQALFKTIDHRSRLPNKYCLLPCSIIMFWQKQEKA